MQPANRAGHALQLVGIDKSFDGIAALSNASLSVAWGEVHALLGENGAGKSTLMNVVCGLYSADSGQVMAKGRPAAIRGTTDAIRLGIGMVHQHYKLVGPFSVAENILLSCGERLGIRSTAEAGRRAAQAAARLGFDLDTQARTHSLSIAERQRIEIVKLVLLGADILLLDEPTAVLTDDEAQAVLGLLREMATQGKAIVLITHRLREVSAYADRVTIMRAGTTVLDAAPAAEMSAAQLATRMVGEAVGHTQPPVVHGEQPVRLRVEALDVKREDGMRAVNHVTMSVRGTQILGIAGVGGNGQTELAETLFGLRPASGGIISVDGERIEHASVAERRRRGVRLVPADRFAFALLADLRAYENLALPFIPAGRYGPAAWLARRAMRRDARQAFAAADVIGGTPRSRTRLLSGGNAQKLLLARELDAAAGVVIAHSPTRGLDVRACHAVHERLVQQVRDGAACVLLSEDLDEVMQLSTHIAVMSRGQLHGPFPRADIERARVGELMAGHA